jgi:GTP cyclohydrolase II
MLYLTPPSASTQADGVIVDPIDMSINATKMAVDYVWNLPLFSKRLGFDETECRQAIHDYTNNDDVLNPELKAFLPPVGGCTIYIVGDIKKLSEPNVEIAIRVHDACCGSDVFGTDICTCRPYLVFAVQAVTECAQRGGVGIIVYFQKEGRSLGEVTKYRVYNARKAQKGGDRPEQYFYQTESIAGIRDARFQEMMPDILVFLGIKRITWLLSMSNEKYDAITDAGIEVMQRVALPDAFVPKNADVEINAKVASGYHTDKVETQDVVEHLRELDTVRKQCSRLYELAIEGKSTHFNVDASKLSTVVDYTVAVTKKNYPDLVIPPHTRWGHMDVKSLTSMVSSWPVDQTETLRRKLDLCTISVLLDAGAGDSWRYRNNRGELVGRSEGLAHAAFEMFENGFFSSDPNCVPHRVNAEGLKHLTEKRLGQGLQVNTGNPLLGVPGRTSLLQRMGEALKNPDNSQFFGKEICRPGNIVDYLLANSTDMKLSLRVLWNAVIKGYESIWPKNLAGVRRGDVWCYSPLRDVGKPGSDMIPFHKLSQWLTYSLLEPLEEFGFVFSDLHLMTALAEYRNGGLLVDLGLIVPKDPTTLELEFDAGSELIVEWRALTITLMDQVADGVRSALGKTADEMTLAMVLQGGTWAAGRAIAATKRPETNAPPIRIRSTGTVF